MVVHEVWQGIRILTCPHIAGRPAPFNATLMRMGCHRAGSYGRSVATPFSVVHRHLPPVVRFRPWLRKEPKWFLRDWSGIEDPGARAETMIACHLLKAVEGWTDLGLGQFELRYLRDKLKREVDFVVIRDRKPWFLVEVKASETKLSDALGYFQAQTKAPHAFQAVMELPFRRADCFERTEPTVVPARTLLSQLL